MMTLIELFAALAKHKIPDDAPQHALLDAPSLLAGARPISHPAFRNVFSQLVASLKANPLTLLLGVSGVGKTRLVLSLVDRLNRLLARDGRIPAVALVAPTSQRAVFSWKAFWERFLAALDDPLPQHKIHPQVRAEALRSRAHGSMRRTTESQYFEMVCSAAAERGLLLLVIDEASVLARSEAGRTLVDQIAVLRELADKDLFRIALVSTYEILPHFRRAGVLDRRLSTVVFPRYAEVLSSDQSAPSGASPSLSRSLDPTDEGYIAFVRSAHTFMERLPESARFALRDADFLQLYRGSLGCVGLLHDWYLRAIVECVECGEHRLDWQHFVRTPLPVDRRANLILEARNAEEQLALLRDLRLDLTEEELYQIGAVQAHGDRSTVSARRSRTSGLAPSKMGKSHRRPGIPNPKTVALP